MAQPGFFDLYNRYGITALEEEINQLNREH
jgi:hypothetical protein